MLHFLPNYCSLLEYLCPHVSCASCCLTIQFHLPNYSSHLGHLRPHKSRSSCCLIIRCCLPHFLHYFHPMFPLLYLLGKHHCHCAKLIYQQSLTWCMEDILEHRKLYKVFSLLKTEPKKKTSDIIMNTTQLYIKCLDTFPFLTSWNDSKGMLTEEPLDSSIMRAAYSL